MHMKSFLGVSAAVVAFGCMGFAYASGEGWTTDFAAAKKQAIESKEDLLIDFSGSDWCPLCIKLDQEVFTKDSFKAGVKGKFVLVTLDFPNDKSKMSAATLQQNAALRVAYGNIVQFPMVLLCDPEGKPYAATTYQEGGPEAYLKHLDELSGIRKKRDAAFANAAGMQGVEKARVLAAAIDGMGLSDAMIATFYGDIVGQIRASDPKDESGFFKSAETRVRIAKFEKELQSFSETQDFTGALGVVDKTLNEGGFPPEVTQKMMMTKALILAELKQFDEAMKVVDQAKAVAPDSSLTGNIAAFRQGLEEAKRKSAGQ